MCVSFGSQYPLKIALVPRAFCSTTATWRFLLWSLIGSLVGIELVYHSLVCISFIMFHHFCCFVWLWTTLGHMGHVAMPRAARRWVPGRMWRGLKARANATNLPLGVYNANAHEIGDFGMVYYEFTTLKVFHHLIQFWTTRRQVTWVQSYIHSWIVWISNRQYWSMMPQTTWNGTAQEIVSLTCLFDQANECLKPLVRGWNWSDEGTLHSYRLVALVSLCIFIIFSG